MKKFYFNYFRILVIGFFTFSFLSSSYAFKVRELTTPLATKYWLAQDQTVPIVTVITSIKGGYAQLPEKYSGIAGLFVQLVTLETDHYSTEKFSRLLEIDGIEISMTIDADYTQIMMRCPKISLNKALIYLRQIIKQKSFRQQTLNQIKAQSINNYRNEISTPDYILTKMIKEHIYHDHPYANIMWLSEQSISNITRQDVRAISSQLLTRNGLKFVICGDINPTDASNIVDQITTELPAATDLKKLSLVNLQSTDTIYQKPTVFPQTVCKFYHSGLAMKDLNFVKLLLVNKIMGEGASSRLFNIVRIQNGYVYSIGSNILTSDQANFWMGKFASDPKNVQAAVKLVQQQWQLLQKNGVTESELKIAKEMIKGQRLLTLNSTVEIASTLIQLYENNFDADYINHFFKLVDQVTLKEINHFIHNFVKPSEMKFFIAGQLMSADSKNVTDKDINND